MESKNVTGDVNRILEKVKAMTINESASLFINEFGISGTTESVACEMNNMMDKHYKEDVPLKPGAAEYVKKLYKEGVKMCVASATAEDLIKICLTRLGIADCFSFFLSCETVGKGKNYPDVYLEAAKRLGSAVGETEVYEDALYAVKTAKKAGFHVTAVYDSGSEKAREKIIKIADDIIIDWRDFI